MTDNPIEATPETPPVTESPEPQAGDSITSSTAPQVPVTAPITVEALPIEHKERFWQIAKTDIEEAYKWLIAEVKKL